MWGSKKDINLSLFETSFLLKIVFKGKNSRLHFSLCAFQTGTPPRARDPWLGFYPPTLGLPPFPGRQPGLWGGAAPLKVLLGSPGAWVQEHTGGSVWTGSLWEVLRERPGWAETPLEKGGPRCSTQTWGHEPNVPTGSAPADSWCGLLRPGCLLSLFLPPQSLRVLHLPPSVPQGACIS